MKLRLRDALDRVLLYLPTACMAALALGTFWMVRTTPPAAPAQALQALGHEPDYFMESFTLKSFDATGRLRTEIQGDKARHYGDNAWTEIDQVRYRSTDDQGRLRMASATLGRSNEDNSEIQLIGNAQVVREGAATVPRVQYRSEYLHIFRDTERLKSHKPVEIVRGKDRFTADAMELDNASQVLTLQGRVHATLAPDPRNP